ncbi:hypothetical protein J5X84_09640 [Streptosporangiaceae bacterium NEAU-GS5]|nr:hypothetical protein [Streptosporangiaceae bacterium NEAU-GS5]
MPLSPRSQALHSLSRMFQAALPPPGQPVTLGEVLTRHAEILSEAHERGLEAAEALLRGRRPEDRPGLSAADFRAVIAREYGFADWAAVTDRWDRPVDPRFEAAADAITSGELDVLRASLDEDPALVRARSAFGHRAALIHYVAANGVESTRQWQSPSNAVEILRLLLDRGANPDELCDTYNGGSAQTPMCLLVSSCHPAEAGVQADLVTELVRGGATPDGLDGDGLPLWTAITFGYTAAASALAQAGARVDNLVFAAALGDLPAVRACFDADGRLRAAGDAIRIGARGPVFDPDHMVEYALIYASAHARREVVEFLLTKNPDLGVTEPMFHGTAAGAARYHGHDDIVALLTS